MTALKWIGEVLVGDDRVMSCECRDGRDLHIISFFGLSWKASVRWG